MGRRRKKPDLTPEELIERLKAFDDTQELLRHVDAMIRHSFEARDMQRFIPLLEVFDSLLGLDELCREMAWYLDPKNAGS